MAKHLRVLIVEDSEDDALLVIRELKRGGYDTTFERVETAEAMTAALEKQVWDIIIADYRLPHFSAPEALELFHQSGLDLPFIVISGTIGEETAVATMKAGAHDYLMKDNLTRLVPAVERELHEAEIRKQRKRAEEALRLAEQNFRNSLDNSPLGIRIVSAEGELLYANQAILDIYGYSSVEELKTMPVKKRYTPESYAEHQKRKGKRKQGKPVPASYEISIVRKDREIRHLITSRKAVVWGGEVQYQVMYQDITEREQAEEMVRESEGKYRQLFELGSDALFLIEVKTGKILDLNNAAIEMYGYSREEALQMKNTDFSSEPDKTRKATLESEKHIPVRYHKRKDGTIFPTDISVAYYTWYGKKVCVAAIRDITERKQTEEEKKKIEAQLQQAQKMEAIGTLAGGIAHDFNNILSLIMGYTELSMMNLPKDSLVRDNMNKLIKAGERARDLVKQILTFSRQSEYEQKPLQIHLIVKEALKLLRPSLPTTIEIRQNIASTGMVMADPTQMHQVIMNLSTNAYHAMQEKGGVLEVSLADVELDSDFTARHLDTHIGPYIRFTVSDTGYGIEKKDIDRIFEPYYTTKEKTGGTGMGLAVVHGIVKSYSGAITVYSEPSKGTTFNVFLPKIEETKVETETEEMGPIPTGNERILLVDDEPAIVDIGKGMLENLGYTVETRTSPIEALEAFKAQPDKFDLVITDMTMPKMTGDELAKELMKIRPDIPIIVCTGFSERINEEKAKAMGIRRLVMKPIVQRELAEAVREALD
jgi:PAS domain S-box-containing protein